MKTKRMMVNAIELAKELGVAPATVRRRWRQSGLDATKAHPLKVALDAWHNDLVRARIRETRERANLHEFQLRERKRDLVPMAEVHKVLNTVRAAIRRVLRDMPQKLAPKCNPSDPEQARQALQLMRSEFLRLLDK